MKILAVDDDPIIRELLVEFVNLVGGHELIVASSGMAAMDILGGSEGHRFDCFLLDIQMPGMDGIELTANIRALPQYADAPILMLTAMSTKRYIDAAFAAGATDYVNKPFEVSELKARLGLVEGVVEARRVHTRKIFATSGIKASVSASDRLELHEPIAIYDVENVIDYLSIQNYLAQLSRTSLFGTTTFAFTIRKVGAHHRAMSAFEFSSMISDVAEVLSDTLSGNQFLMSYAGSGTFVCVTESGWRPDPRQLMDNVNLTLSQTELFDNSGARLHVRVSAGDAIRLIWQSEQTVMDAVGKAHASAEAASAAHERSMNDFWLQERLA